MSPRKVRLVVDMIRGKSVVDSIKILNFTVKRARTPILKLLNSAIANSKNIETQINLEDLYIKEIKVDKGPTLKRHMPRSKGMANPIMKRTSHIVIVLDKTKNSVTKNLLKNKNQQKLKLNQKDK